MAVTTLLRTVARQLVTRLGLHPKYFGYRVMRQVPVTEFLTNEAVVRTSVADPGRPRNAPLPCNVSSWAQMPPGSVWGKSFAGAATHAVQGSTIVTVRDCTVSIYIDPHRNEFPLLSLQDGTVVPARGTGSGPHQAALLRKAHETPVIASGAWICENWYGNHYHWLVYHLPKVLFLRRHAPHLDLLMCTHDLPPKIATSLAMLGYPAERIRLFKSPVSKVSELTYVDIDQHHPKLLEELAGAFRQKGAPESRRRIYISRADAGWRSTTNESEVLELVETRGFDIVQMQGMTFEEQVTLMQSASIVLSAHGAGLANMVFAAQGADIVEIANPAFPNPDYYSLATALGHRYWYFAATPEGTLEPALQDISVSIDGLSALLDRVISQQRDRSRTQDVNEAS